MAVTSSTNNYLTLIHENGGSPTGVGGNIINENFKRIDNMIQTSGSQAYVSKAYSASYANYAYSCAGGSGSSGSSSSSEIPEFAKATGFKNPYSSNYQHSSSYPYAIYGSTYSCYTSGGSQVSAITPYGPFMMHLMLCIQNQAHYGSWGECAFAEVMIFGWNSSIKSVKVLHMYDEDGNEIASSNYSVTHSTSLYTAVDTSKDCSMVFAINGGNLYCCGYKSGSSSSSYVYATSIALYPSNYTQGYNTCS